MPRKLLITEDTHFNPTFVENACIALNIAMKQARIENNFKLEKVANRIKSIILRGYEKKGKYPQGRVCSEWEADINIMVNWFLENEPYTANKAGRKNKLLEFSPENIVFYEV